MADMKEIDALAIGASPDEAVGEEEGEEDYNKDDPWMFLDPYDSHLDCRVEEDALTATCLHTEGFQYLWKGIRGNYGISKGMYMYEVKVVDHLQVQMPETRVQNQNILRCGFSLPMTSLFLGDTAESWGWGGTGKKSHNNEFKDYGGQFRAGDVVGCIIDMDNLTVSFMKNGQFCGLAFDNVPESARETGVFPHLLMKNVRVKCNFRRQDAWFPPPSEAVKFFEDAAEEESVVNPVDHPESLADAEFILLAGLPGCGKTYWAQKHMEANPKKNYLLMGTNAVIDQMKVMQVGRQRNYADRWSELISQATPIFNKLVEIAGKTPRNIILDQTNVYKNARRRKAGGFLDFGTRTCCVIVNDEETLAARTEKREREEGKFVPVAAVNEMRANFSTPELEDGFTELEFPELPEAEAREAIQRLRGSGADWKRRNPGQKGSQAKGRLETRDAANIGKGTKGKGKGEKEGMDKPRGRSRSPNRGGKGKGGL